GQDKLPVALGNLWKGQEVVVGCIQMLWQKADDVSVELYRTPVQGSIIAIGEDRKAVAIKTREGMKLTLERPAFVGYRPMLKMKLADFGLETEEWGERRISWYLKLEEV